MGGQLLISPPQLISAPINLRAGSKWSKQSKANEEVPSGAGLLYQPTCAVLSSFSITSVHAGGHPWVGVSPAPTSASLGWMHPGAGHALLQLRAGRGYWSPSGAGETKLLSAGIKKQAARCLISDADTYSCA